MEAKTYIYWEKQQKLLCAIHATNALLQGPYCNFEDFRKIAIQCDDYEKALLEPEESKQKREMNIGDLSNV